MKYGCIGQTLSVERQSSVELFALKEGVSLITFSLWRSHADLEIDGSGGIRIGDLNRAADSLQVKEELDAFQVRWSISRSL